MFALRLDYVRFLPDPRFLLFVLQYIFGYKNEQKMRLNMNEMAPFGPLVAFSRAVALKTGMENPKDMAVFAGERYELPEDFVSLSSKCNRCHSYLRRVVRLSGIP